MAFKLWDNITIEPDNNGNYEIVIYDSNAIMRTTWGDKYPTPLKAYIDFINYYDLMPW